MQRILVTAVVIASEEAVEAVLFESNSTASTASSLAMTTAVTKIRCIFFV